MDEGSAIEVLGYESWLQDQWEEQHRRQIDAEAKPISEALGDGDIKALATYLKGNAVQRADLPEDVVVLPRWLAEEIVDMINGDHWFRLDVRSRKRGQKRSHYIRRWADRMRVGYFVEARIRQLGPGNHESVIQEALETFRTPHGDSHHRSYVTKAHAEVRKVIKEWDAAGTDGWRLLSKFYAAKVPG